MPSESLPPTTALSSAPLWLWIRSVIVLIVTHLNSTNTTLPFSGKL